MRAPIHSNKHYVQKSLSTILAAAVDVNDIVIAVTPSGVNLVNEVVEGALVKAVFIEEWFRTGDTSPGSFVTILEKVPGAQGPPSAAEMAALGTYNNKKNILFTSQALLNDQDADAIPILRGWIKIPKGKQRFGLGDTLRLVTFAQSLDIIRCGFSTYKEYT